MERPLALGRTASRGRSLSHRVAKLSEGFFTTSLLHSSLENPKVCSNNVATRSGCQRIRVASSLSESFLGRLALSLFIMAVYRVNPTAMTTSGDLDRGSSE